MSVKHSMSVKHFFFLFLFLVVPGTSFASFLCTATSDNYRDMPDGLVFSREAALRGAQGTEGGHQLLHQDGRYAYSLVAGQVMKVGNGPTELKDFYVELRSIASGTVMRARSGRNDNPRHAQLELITYAKDSFLYDGILLFSCKQYLFGE
ncbi:MAG: hypothetical protein CSB48_01885 [Proteobacteria bacterium]|nr:MAG: hypothetical protein CSB48_01885 [Pseudomonadota bacterium]PIE40387.1 MAG: hypothetical protein CSA51_00905 [Gammaproteobacteria bacterium]